MTTTSGDQVFHGTHGNGTVVMTDGDTAVVRFDSGLQQVLMGELSRRLTVRQALAGGRVHSPLETLLHLQAELITSLNDTWGVFSRSRISLLPHQLWVCYRVLGKHPPRWLIADDVGLGKTIEAGLILWPLLSRRQVTRLLILTPASLTTQWRDRMFSMFDIRLMVYDPLQDQPTTHGRANYWHIHQQVVASLQTLRDDRKGRHERLLDAEPWDLVMVDEAHHLNVDDKSGATLGYELIEKMLGAGKIKGLILFTATPHRGKDYGFISLLELLDDKRFDREMPISGQLQHLPGVMIRNNKQNVTDLQGQRLFKPPIVESEEYDFSPAEAEFYSKMTEFIATGQAYAATLGGGRNTQAVILVLIALQKLASSSVAAVRRALRKRLARITHLLAEPTVVVAPDFTPEDSDTESAFTESVGDWSSGLALMENEREHLQELIALAERITDETKIRTILAQLEDRFAGRTVLFFTECKATQSLLMSALIQRYGENSTTFINGEGRAYDVLGLTLTTSREAAAHAFNMGRVRFLVSTEAAGEGIDLQGNCHTLIHVDLPWNPMRLHQRVGRLNRYGQKEQVHVLSLRNPNTVEAMIWEKLNAKIESIKRAFDAVMDEPEDLLQLVLGMASPHFFEQVFVQAPGVARQHLDDWFDRETAQFGGQDVLRTVRELVGHSAHFDFQEASGLIPRVDLPDLLPFFRTAVRFNHRLIDQQDGLVSFKTPEEWLAIGIRSSYSDLAFKRDGSGSDVAGVGHKVVNAALEQARHLSANASIHRWQGLTGPLYVFRVTDKVSSVGGLRRTFIGRLMGETPTWLRDWELLQYLNTIHPTSDASSPLPEIFEPLLQGLNDEMVNLSGHLPSLDLNYAAPEVEAYAMIAPAPE